MLNKSHPLIHSADIRQIEVKLEKKCMMLFDPDARVFVLSNLHKIQLCDKFSSVIFIFLIPFSQLQFGLIGCMILMKEYIFLTTATMKIGKIYFYSDHSNGCYEEKSASLDNSMLNHPGHVTLTSLTFLKILPVVGIIEILKF